MFSFNFSQLKNTLNSFNIFNISFSLNKVLKVDETNNDKLVDNIEEIIQLPIYKDYKTTLDGGYINLIQNLNKDILIYLFIEKERKHGAWNLVAPIVISQDTNEVLLQYGLHYFALQGCGGGLNNTKSILYHAKKLQDKGYKVQIYPKVVKSKLISDFEYWDSEVNLNDLKNNSIHLFNYRKDIFESIYSTYIRLMNKNNLNLI